MVSACVRFGSRAAIAPAQRLGPLAEAKRTLEGPLLEGRLVPEADMPSARLSQKRRAELRASSVFQRSQQSDKRMHPLGGVLNLPGHFGRHREDG
jgi:hypothetical protein